MTTKLQVNSITASSGSGTITVPSGTVLTFPGTILQVQVASSGPRRQTIASLLPVAIDNLFIHFTPVSPTSKILVQAVISTNASYVSNYSVYKNGLPTKSTTGTTNTSRIDTNFTTYIGGSAVTSDELWCHTMQWSELAGSTDTRLYTINACSAWSGTAYTLHINNRNSNDMASFSYLTIMEISQ